MNTAEHTPAVVKDWLTTRYAPEGMVVVSKDQFFAAVGRGNVHPRPERDHSVWSDLNTRAVIGVTTPGYINPGLPRVYMLAAAIAKAVQS